jgi:hypothetical protein
MLLKSMSQFVEARFGTSTPKPISMANGSAAAPVRAVDVSAIRPKLPDDEPVEIPVLGPDPTEEELINYANALPAVRAAKRVFRAKVIEVKKA